MTKPWKKNSELHLSNGLVWSVILHVFLFSLVILKSMLFPSHPEIYIPSLKVDVVGLPDLLKNQPVKVGKPKSSPAPSQKTASKEEMTLRKKKKAIKHKKRRAKLKSAIDRIRALHRIREEDTEETVEQIKGNIVSPGSSTAGEAREAAQASYYDLVLERLKSHWALPVWLSRQNLSARVAIFINAQGRVRSFSFQQPSGSTQFDDAVRQAIEDAQPFPVPPQEIEDQLLTDGILLGFPL